MKITGISQSDIENILRYRYFEDDCIQPTYTPGTGRTLILSGDNATGKSFFCKLLAELLRQNKVEAMLTSMAGRTTSGLPRMFIYGTEDDMATGVNSVQVVKAGISTCEKRESPHVIFWDEPDIGLSESYHRSLGQYLTTFVTNLPEHTRGVVITTHSREIVRQLRTINPHFIRFGDTKSLDEWLDSPVEHHTVDELLALDDRANQTRKAVQDRIKGR